MLTDDDANLALAASASRLVTLSNALAATAAVLWLGGCGAAVAGLTPGLFVGIPGFVMLVVAAVVGQVGRAKQKKARAD